MTIDTMRPWQVARGGGSVILRIRLTPGSSTDAVDGVDTRTGTPVLRVRVRKVPENGKANAALEALLAAWLRIPNRSISITAGHKSRTKTVVLAGEPAVLIDQLQHEVAALAATPRRRCNV